MSNVATKPAKNPTSAKPSPGVRTVVSRYIVGRAGETTEVTVRIELPTNPEGETAGEGV